MKLYGRSTISEFLGDNIVFRSLNSLDKRLPSLEELRAIVNIHDQSIPRKTSTDYANLVSHLLKRARALEAPGTIISRLLFVGDTRLNDATAFNKICAAGDWPGIAFICAEKIQDEPYLEILEQEERRLLYLANRWEYLSDFDQNLARHDFQIDESTAIILDLDKTCLGARGRNDQVINQVRVEAAFATVEDLIGSEFDAEAFEKSYNLFNEPDFHPFTTDNQDYLVYICLIISTGLYEQEKLAEDIRKGGVLLFDQFLNDVQAQAKELPVGVREIHRDVFARVQQGDPTPFKAFRAQEYLATVAHMGQMGEAAPLDERLSQEILITQEVRERAEDWLSRGALLFGLSDKPDEASIPSTELASQGYLPIHKVETSVVGG
ncbi:MAG: hypothetical protein HQ525_00935 [Anaerolineae bacterium]|nr:hypothetical protein [Anaerolineae bacterium]